MPDADGVDDGAAMTVPEQDTVAGGADGGGSPADEPTGADASGEEVVPLDGADGAEQQASPSGDAAEQVHELDEVLAGSEDAARAALTEITPADTIGALVATVAQGEHVVSLQFENLMRGYPGWLWTATLSRIDDTEDVNVLEVELLPGEGAVLAPDWVPWSVRLADYRAAQDAAGEEFEEVDDVEPDDEDEFDDSDDEDSDDEDDSDEDDSDEDDSDEDDSDEDDSDEDDSDEDDSDEDDSDEDDSDEDDDDSVEDEDEDEDEDDSGDEDDSDDDR